MIVTIDGPAGAGKSHVAHDLARRLGFRFLNTGAMYRAVALAALRGGVPWSDAQQVARVARQCDIELDGDRVLLAGEDVSDAIRTVEVTALVKHVADNPDVRQHLVEQQRCWAARGDVVAEGRDQGTVAFPHAECKIFLTASPEERARRRHRDLASRGVQVDLGELLDQQNRRDKEDATREVGRLEQAADAHLVCTDGLTLEQVVEHLAALVSACRV
jgi:CMP/dCMP kinase